MIMFVSRSSLTCIHHKLNEKRDAGGLACPVLTQLLCNINNSNGDKRAQGQSLTHFRRKVYLHSQPIAAGSIHRAPTNNTLGPHPGGKKAYLLTNISNK